MTDRFKPLLDFFRYLQSFLEDLPGTPVDCGDCNKCCRYPYFYMSLFRPEFDMIHEYIRENNIPIRVQFETADSPKFEKRVYFKDWVCPMYRRDMGGCAIYPVRPFSCRVFGPYTREEDEIDTCHYKERQFFDSLNELPFWERYVEAMEQFDDLSRGYIFPESALYDHPALEFLIKEEYPWSLCHNYEKEAFLTPRFPRPIDQMEESLIMRFGTNALFTKIIADSPGGGVLFK